MVIGPVADRNLCGVWRAARILARVAVTPGPVIDSQALPLLPIFLFPTASGIGEQSDDFRTPHHSFGSTLVLLAFGYRQCATSISTALHAGIGNGVIFDSTVLQNIGSGRPVE